MYCVTAFTAAAVQYTKVVWPRLAGIVPWTPQGGQRLQQGPGSCSEGPDGALAPFAGLFNPRCSRFVSCFSTAQHFVNHRPCHLTASASPDLQCLSSSATSMRRGGTSTWRRRNSVTFWRGKSSTRRCTRSATRSRSSSVCTMSLCPCAQLTRGLGQEVALLEAEARARLDILAAVRARTASAIWRNPVNEMFGEHNERVTSIS